MTSERSAQFGDGDAAGTPPTPDGSPAAGISELRDVYRRYRVQTFVLTWTAYASMYLCRKNFSVAKERLADLYHLSNAQLGDLDTGYLVAYAVGQFVNGTLGDRIGGKRLVGFGLVATALLNMVFGVGQSFLFFLVPWTLNGFAQSAGWPGCAKAFSNWFARDERGTVMGVWCTCYQAGSVVSTIVATWLLVTFGWQSAFFGPALLVGGFALLFFARQKRAPEAEGLPHVETYYAAVTGRDVPADVPAVGSDAAGSDAAGPERATSWDNILLVLRSRPIWTLGLTYVVLKFVRYSFLFWLPFYMAQRLEYEAGTAGYTSVAFDLAGIAGAIVAGILSDRVFGSRRGPIVVILMTLLAGVTYLYGPLSQSGWLQNAATIALIGFLLYGADSVTAGVAAVDFGHKRAASLAAGFVNGLGSIGAAMSGFVIGRVSGAYGWDAVFHLFGPLCLAGALLMTTMWRTMPEGAESAGASATGKDESG